VVRVDNEMSIASDNTSKEEYQAAHCAYDAIDGLLAERQWWRRMSRESILEDCDSKISLEDVANRVGRRIPPTMAAGAMMMEYS
jgi:hypothetical protein